MSAPAHSAHPVQSAESFAVILRGLRLRCVVGVDAAESSVRQEIRADLRLEVSPPAGATPSADYAAVASRLREMAESERILLLEDMAVRIAEIVLSDFPAVSRLTVRVAKPHVLPGLPEAAVELTRVRS